MSLEQLRPEQFQPKTLTRTTSTGIALDFDNAVPPQASHMWSSSRKILYKKDSSFRNEEFLFINCCLSTVFELVKRSCSEVVPVNTRSHLGLLSHSMKSIVGRTIFVFVKSMPLRSNRFESIRKQFFNLVAVSWNFPLEFSILSATLFDHSSLIIPLLVK